MNANVGWLPRVVAIAAMMSIFAGADALMSPVRHKAMV